MKAIVGLAVGLLVGLTASLALDRTAGAVEDSAFAIMMNSAGERIGTATLVESAAGDVRVTIEVTGLSPGEHGFHVHAVGLCDPSAFLTAGGHFNPHAR